MPLVLEDLTEPKEKAALMYDFLRKEGWGKIEFGDFGGYEGKNAVKLVDETIDYAKAQGDPNLVSSYLQSITNIRKIDKTTTEVASLMLTAWKDCPSDMFDKTDSMYHKLVSSPFYFDFISFVDSAFEDIFIAEWKNQRYEKKLDKLQRKIEKANAVIEVCVKDALKSGEKLRKDEEEKDVNKEFAKKVQRLLDSTTKASPYKNKYDEIQFAISCNRRSTQNLIKDYLYIQVRLLEKSKKSSQNHKIIMDIIKSNERTL